MKLTFISGLLFSMTVLGASAPKIYPKRLDGRLITGITQATPINIVTGEPKNCEKKTYLTTIIYTCDLDTGYALISNPGAQPEQIKFDVVIVTYAKSGDTMRRTFEFGSNWISNDKEVPLRDRVALRFSFKDTNPLNIRGNLEMMGYYLKQALQLVDVSDE